jgi:WD40 repeat protein
VTSLKFSQDVKTLISLSKDHTFKIWRKSIASTGRISWTLKTTCFKNNSLLLNDVQISFDSSVAAVIFDTKFITFWKTENGEPVARECCNVNGATSFEVVGVSFATGINSHVFVEVRSDRIRVWNFLKKCLSWTYSSSLMQNKKLGNEFFVNMALDDSTNRIAIYCKDFSILIFDLLDPEPHSIVRDDVLKEQTLTCCLFAPSRFVDHDLSCGSSLLFFNDKRQLIGLIPKGGKTKTKAIESSESMEVDEPTKGSINILGEKVFVDTVLPTEEELRNEGMKQLLRARNVIEAEFDVSRIADLLMVQPPSHILPSIHQLSKTFMTSLFLKRDPPSLQKIKLKRRLHNNETTMRAGDEEDDDSE